MLSMNLFIWPMLFLDLINLFLLQLKDFIKELILDQLLIELKMKMNSLSFQLIKILSHESY